MLIFQEPVPASQETNPNVDITAPLAKELDEIGKVAPIIYDPGSKLFQLAIEEGRFKEAPAEPSRDQVFAIARALQCRYVLVVKSYRVGETIRASAELFRQGGHGAIWVAPERGFAAAAGDTPDIQTAAVSAGRTIALQIVSDPLKNEEAEPVLPDTDPGEGSGNVTAAAPPENRPWQDGLVALDGGDLTEAAALFRAAVDQDPLNGRIRATLAETYMELGMTDQALAEVVRSLGLLPGDKALAIMHGRVLARSGDLRNAEIAFRTLLSKDSDDVQAIVGLAEVLTARLQPEEAAAMYRRARTLAPDDPQIAWALSEVLAMQGDYQASLKERDAALALGLSAEDSAVLARYQRLMAVVANAGTQAAKDAQDLHAEAARVQAQPDFNLNARVAGLLVQVNSMIDYLEQLSPPKPYVGSHRERLFAMNLLSQSIVTIKQALEQGKPAALDDASLTLTEAARELANASSSYELERAKRGS
jgi:tetratricopeptide (TPR) repeat protein